MSPTDEHRDEDTVEKTKAVVRRLQAALAPSLFHGERPSDKMIVRELRAMLASEGVRQLLSKAPSNQFADVIRRAQAVLDGGGADADIINRLWHFMDDAPLNKALETDNVDEKPMELVRLMLEGPYKQLAATGS
jgi:hypothetical protein